MNFGKMRELDEHDVSQSKFFIYVASSNMRL